ncbi:hypothetical protein GCM10027359_14950 [Marilutibacter aestuarii]
MEFLKNCRHLTCAALLCYSMASMAFAGEGTQASGVPLDFSRSVLIEIEIDIPKEETSIEALSQYLDTEGFQLHIHVYYRETGEALGESLEFQSKRLSAKRSGALSPDALATLSERVATLAEPLGSPRWKLSQVQSDP